MFRALDAHSAAHVLRPLCGPHGHHRLGRQARITRRPLPSLESRLTPATKRRLHDWGGGPIHPCPPDQMLFGAPARYISYSPQSLEKWDEAVAQADEEYRHKIHCMVCGSDCHSHTARALDLSNVSTPPALARAHALFYVRPQLMRPSLPGGRLRLPQQSGARRARLLLWATRWHGRLPQDVARLRAARWDLVPHPLVKTTPKFF